MSRPTRVLACEGCAVDQPIDSDFETLLHDALEACVGDVPRLLKRLLPDVCALEDQVAGTVRIEFGLPAVPPPEVELVDGRVLVTEARAFGKPWWSTLELLPIDALDVDPRPWHMANSRILSLARSLLGRSRNSLAGATSRPTTGTR